MKELWLRVIRRGLQTLNPYKPYIYIYIDAINPIINLINPINPIYINPKRALGTVVFVGGLVGAYTNAWVRGSLIRVSLVSGNVGVVKDMASKLQPASKIEVQKDEVHSRPA